MTLLSVFISKTLFSVTRSILRNVHGNKDESGFSNTLAKTCHTGMEKWKAKLNRISVL